MAALSARRRRMLLGPPPPPDDGARPARDDAGRILVLLGLFTIAMLIVVGAVLWVAAVDSWEALAVVLVVHLLATMADFAGVVYVFRGREGRRPGGPVPSRGSARGDAAHDAPEPWVSPSTSDARPSGDAPPVMASRNGR